MPILGQSSMLIDTFGWRAASGGAYEMRTVGALSLRLVFWVLVSAIVMRSLPATPLVRAD